MTRTILWIGFAIFIVMHGTPSIHDMLMIWMDRFMNGG